MSAKNLKAAKIAQDAPQAAARNEVDFANQSAVETVFCAVATRFMRCGIRATLPKFDFQNFPAWLKAFSRRAVETCFGGNARWGKLSTP